MAQRVRLQRAKGWRKPPNTVVVSRPSRFGNPFAMADAMQRDPALTKAEARRVVVDEFRRMTRSAKERERQGYPGNDEIKRELRGKNLACWCPEDGPCHADVLLEIANE
jgi:uncharacterized protein DUF4326